MKQLRRSQPSLGDVTIQDPRLNIERTLPITVLELRDGRLHLEATAEFRTAGSVRDDDVITIRDPGGRTVLRTWADTGGRVWDVEAGERFTLTLPVSLGGHRPLVTGDSTLAVDL